MSHFRDDYTAKYDDNLFIPLFMAPDVKKQIDAGRGAETRDGKKRPAKLRSLRSSSALAVNVFLYWHTKARTHQIAHACGICEKNDRSFNIMAFERPFPIFGNHVPHLDVVLENQDRVVAIESKFLEPYQSSPHKTLEEVYDKNVFWEQLGSLREFAFGPRIGSFQHLHAGQLIKHILGLTQNRKRGGKQFELLYLWYDMNDSPEAARHREEIDKLARLLSENDITFRSLTYQKLIYSLFQVYFRRNEKYFDYIIGRYL